MDITQANVTGKKAGAAPAKAKKIASHGKQKPEPVTYPKFNFVQVGQRIFIEADSYLRAIGKDPAKEPADQAKIITIDRALEISDGLISRTTLWRMRRAAEKQENAA
jgi:hypothetical protein